MIENELVGKNYFGIAGKIGLIFLLSIVMFSANAMALDLSQFEFVANTTSDSNGNFTFEDIPNGEYVLYSVNESYSSKYDEWRWYNGKVDINVNSLDITDLELEVASGSDINQNEVLAYLDRSSITGNTYLYAMSKYYYKESTLVLVDKQTDELIANTTSDNNGNFTFEDIPNGEYTLYSVNESYSSKYDEWRWYNGKVDINVNSSDITDLELEVASGSDIDQNEVLAYLDRSSITGNTYLYAMSKYYYKESTLVLVDKQTDELIANTTSDNNGNFTFEDIPNGEYTLYSVNESYSSKYDEWRWYNGKVDINVNSSDITDLKLEVASGSDIDQNEVLAYLDRSSITGNTYLYAMSKYYYKESTLVLLKQKATTEVTNAPHLEVAIVTGYSSYEEELANFTNRINFNSDLNITVSTYITTKLSDDIDLSNMDIIYIVMVTQSAAEFEDTIQAAIDNGSLVIGSNTYLPESDYTAPSEYDDTSFKQLLSSYWSGASFDDSNFDNLIFFLAQEYYDRADLTVEEPTGLSRAIYHPAMTDSPVEYFTGDAADYFEWYTNRTDGHAFDESAPTIGITFYSSYYPDDMDPIDKLIEGFEDKGANVIACYGKSGYYLDPYLNHSNETKVEAVVSFHYRGNYFDLEELGVPVMNAVLNGYMNTSEWLETSTPLPTTNMLRIYGPETDGLIDPIMIGALETFVVDNSTVEKYIGHDEQIDWLIDRTIAQANLSIEKESDKKIAIIYYNHGGGKDNIGASYLEVAPSIMNLLEGMDEAGYDVDGALIPNKTELVDLMINQGRNVGTWAPGELDKMVETGKVELIPESTYLSWFNELPEVRRTEVIDMWGEAPGEIMVYTDGNDDKFIVIPKISLSDNVILAPQPTRGWLQDNEVLYHDEELPPHHQYIAFYLWMQNDFDADAMVNMGRHGTVEWLPGKDFCLLSEEWPAIMTGDIPVVYPYVMDGMGEGMQAKRRGNAMVIDHLIPPVVSAGSYGNYSVLNNKINVYKTSVTESEALLQAHLQDIITLTLDLGLDNRVNMSLAQDNATVDVFLDDLDDVLRELRSQSMPYGLHILGEAPQDDELVGMVNSMLGDDYTDAVAAYNDTESAPFDMLSLVLLDSMNITDAQMQILGNTSVTVESDLNNAISYAELLYEANNEIEQVLKAMDGGYIEPNLGGDPILRPDTLPSGTNFYAFDEQMIPTTQAWESATVLVDKWIEDYRAEHGEYPNKAGYILWAGESTRHEGVMEAQIFYLLGIKPVWDEDNSKVVDVELIPTSELGRPRIDVMVQISGLYRDTFPMKVQLIDKAVRLAYGQDESDNYIRENTNALQLALNDTIGNYNLSLDIAQFRVFGPADGSYGTGMSNAVSASNTWEDNSELAELYINKMSYVYGQNIWGQTTEEYIKQETGEDIHIDDTLVFEKILTGTDVLVHSRSSNTYGATNTDEFYQYLSGLANAIKAVSGEEPDLLIANLENPDDLKVEDVETYLENELYTVFSDMNIQGWMAHGYEGARMMMNFVENLWGIEALTPGLVTDDMWDQTYGKFVVDKTVSDWMKDVSPYAYESTTGRLIEVVRTGHWNPSDKVLEHLVNEYLDTVIENGVTCCHHTCGNPMLDEFIQSEINSGKIQVSQTKMDEYKKIMEETRNPLPKAPTPTSTPSTRQSSSDTGTELNVVETNGGNQTTYSDSGAGEVMEEEASLKSPIEDSYVEGYEMTRETVEDEAESSPYSISGSDVVASVLVIGLVGTMYVGFWRRRKL
ncbi:cobaltochelatase subunit CobN [uncultured Methanolobus sp.]|uniref:cobaltochelatase subunit CobN n=1 Tax=uncultured Methanolobus sp. TaxID=218300 RepID=UPI0029C5FF0C|nr:cobaltochelatase subunit CobN [uncultured Methanolobus sp.]